MAFINITTNNLSRDLVSVPTFLDNWVYIPRNCYNWRLVKTSTFTFS